MKVKLLTLFLFISLSVGAQQELNVAISKSIEVKDDETRNIIGETAGFTYSISRQKFLYRNINCATY